jgi:hypothetical protein
MFSRFVASGNLTDPNEFKFMRMREQVKRNTPRNQAEQLKMMLARNGL